MLKRDNLARPLGQRPVTHTSDPFVEVTKLWWEKFVEKENWFCAAELGRLCAKRRPTLAYGWENWAWGLHRTGDSLGAYKVLAPMIKRLKATVFIVAGNDDRERRHEHWR